MGGGRKAPGIPGRPQAPVCRQASCAACGSAAPHFTVTSLANRARGRARSLSRSQLPFRHFLPSTAQSTAAAWNVPAKIAPVWLGRANGRQAGTRAMSTALGGGAINKPKNDAREAASSFLACLSLHTRSPSWGGLENTTAASRGMMRAERRRHAPLEAARIAGLRGREPARETRHVGVETPSSQTAGSGCSYWVESKKAENAVSFHIPRPFEGVYSSLSKHRLSIPSRQKRYTCSQ